MGIRMERPKFKGKPGPKAMRGGLTTSLVLTTADREIRDTAAAEWDVSLAEAVRRIIRSYPIMLAQIADQQQQIRELQTKLGTTK